jgi:hypothetical protein
VGCIVVRALRLVGVVRAFRLVGVWHEPLGSSC